MVRVFLNCCTMHKMVKLTRKPKGFDATLLFCAFCKTEKIYHPKYGWICPKCNVLPEEK